MVAGSIKHEDRVSARGDLFGYLHQVQVHRLRVGARQDEGGGRAALRADGAEDIGPFITLVARRARTRAAFGPHTGQRALLT
jgi:hypothetical protein